MSSLIIGGGSAGLRHCRLASSLGVGPVTLVSKTAPPDSADTVVRELGEIDLSAGFQLAVIASPATFHEQQVRTLSSHPIPILVEKPLAHDYAGAKALLDIPDLDGRTRVAYNLRFDPGFQAFRELIRGNIAGKPLSFRAYAGQDLRRWRPHRDYRETVSARRDLGGGVLLEISHEIDYLIQLAGNPESVSATADKIGDLDIDVEDSADLQITFATGIRAHLHLNMLEHPPRRFCKVICSNGVAEWNLIEGYVRFALNSEDGWHSVWTRSDQDADTTYREQMKAMVALSQSQRPESGAETIPILPATLADAATVLNVVDSARHSSRENRQEIPLR